MSRVSDPPFDHFGLLAPLYESIISLPDAPILLKLVAPQPDDILLDIGGGTGRVSQFFREHVCQIHIVDISEGMLRQAQAKGGLYTELGASERLPFRDRAFQRIIAVDSFHHFRQHARVAHELLRVLAPGGRLVLEEPDIRLFHVKLIALMETLTLMRSHFYRPHEIIQFFTTPGYTITLHEGSNLNFWIVVDRDSQ